MHIKISTNEVERSALLLDSSKKSLRSLHALTLSRDDKGEGSFSNVFSKNILGRAKQQSRLPHFVLHVSRMYSRKHSARRGL